MRESGTVIPVRPTFPCVRIDFSRNRGPRSARSGESPGQRGPVALLLGGHFLILGGVGVDTSALGAEAWGRWGCIGLPTPGAARGGLARGAAGAGGPWQQTGVSVPPGTLTPQHAAGEAQRKALLCGELRRAPESQGQRASVPSVL